MWLQWVGLLQPDDLHRSQSGLVPYRGSLHPGSRRRGFHLSPLPSAEEAQLRSDYGSAVFGEDRAADGVRVRLGWKHGPILCDQPHRHGSAPHQEDRPASVRLHADRKTHYGVACKTKPHGTGSNHLSRTVRFLFVSNLAYAGGHSTSVGASVSGSAKTTSHVTSLPSLRSCTRRPTLDGLTDDQRCRWRLRLLSAPGTRSAMIAPSRSFKTMRVAYWPAGTVNNRPPGASVTVSVDDHPLRPAGRRPISDVSHAGWQLRQPSYTRR